MFAPSRWEFWSTWRVHSVVYKVKETSADTLTTVLSDVLCRMDLSISNCQEQCYDQVSNISGVRRDIATQFLSEEPCALYNHCYGHASNLAIGNTIKQVTKGYTWYLLWNVKVAQVFC